MNPSNTTPWEQAVLALRKQPEYAKVLADTYLGPDLLDNAERFYRSEEFRETVGLIRKFHPNAVQLLDIGSGNGISAVAFARLGYRVTAAEPDPGLEVGRGAIARLKEHYRLDTLAIVDSLGESLPFAAGVFDLVYIRQAMHHAQHLDRFVAEAARVLKSGGHLMTVRDHVVFSVRDKELFLRTHPLHAYYGGENAFSEQEYLSAFRKAGLDVVQVLRLFDSVINYAPMTRQEIQELPAQFDRKIRALLVNRLGSIADRGWIRNLAGKWIRWKAGGPTDERQYPGRMYTFICRKP